MVSAYAGLRRPLLYLRPPIRRPRLYLRPLSSRLGLGLLPQLSSIVSEAFEAPSASHTPPATTIPPL